MTQTEVLHITPEQATNYRLVLDSSFALLQEQYSTHQQKELHDKEWKLDSSTNDIQSYKLATPEMFPSIFVSKTCFDICSNAENIAHLLLDPSEILKLDNNTLAKVELLGEVILPKSKASSPSATRGEPQPEVVMERSFLWVYTEKQYAWPINQRYYVLLKAVRKLSNGMYFITRTSVEYPDYIGDKLAVRGEYLPGSGTILLPLSHQQCTFISITKMDKHGFLPVFVLHIQHSKEKEAMLLLRTNAPEYLKSRCNIQLGTAAAFERVPSKFADITFYRE